MDSNRILAHILAIIEFSFLFTATVAAASLISYKDFIFLLVATAASYKNCS